MGTHPKLDSIKVNPTLLEECSDPPKLYAGTKGDVIIYIHDIKTAYQMCKDKHKALATSCTEIINTNEKH